MPYKSEKVKIAGTQFDLRRKLSPEQVRAVSILSSQGYSQRQLATMFGCSKSTIFFTLRPGEPHFPVPPNTGRRPSGVIVPESSNYSNPVRCQRKGVPQQRKQMKKYEVTLYYHTSIEVVVEAEDEKEAIANAYLEGGKSKYNNEFLNNAQEDGAPTVIEIGEEG